MAQVCGAKNPSLWSVRIEGGIQDEKVRLVPGS